MRHIFIARHGDYIGNELTVTGEQDIERLADSIGEILNGNSVYLISSEVKRAVRSADIIAEKLGLPAEFKKVDWLFNGNHETYERMDSIIQYNNKDALIAVGHKGFVNGYPLYYMRHHHELNNINFFRPKKGQYIYIDRQTSSHILLP